MSRKVYEISFNIAGRLASTFTGAFSTASSQLRVLGNDIKQLKGSLRSLDEEYKKGAISAQAYQAAHQRLSGQLEKTLQIQQRLSLIQQRQNELQQRSDQLRSQMIDTAALAAPFVMAARAAIKFEDAMLDVAKQADGARDESGKLTPVYYQMRKEIQMLGREIPIATNEIAQMVAAGLRMGVARDQIIDFTRDTAKMATAFEAAPQEIGEKMGMISNVMGIPITKLKDLGDTINWLDDQSNAKGMDIINVLLRIGGTAKQINLTEHQAAALASTFLSLGKSEEVAATAANALMRELVMAKQQPRRFQEALAQLGMTAEEVNKGMVKDAQGTILKVLDAINKLPKARQTEVTVGLFGKEYGDDIATLAGAIDVYRKQLALLNDEKRKGSMDREFRARQEATSAQLQLMQNAATEAAVNFGTVLLPALNNVFGGIARVAQVAAEFAEKNPNVTQAIMTCTVSLIGFRLAWLGLAFVWNQAKKMGTDLQGIITRKAAAQTIATNRTIMAAKAVQGLTLAQRGLNLAMASNPIGLVISAVATLLPLVIDLDKAVGWVIGKFKALKSWAAGTLGIGKKTPKGMGDLRMAGYASGGFALHPQIAAVAERGPEAIIPLDGSRRSVSLWEKTGKIIGARQGDIIIYATFAPVINGGGPEIIPALQQQQKSFLEQLQDVIHQERRLKYA
ncbi:MAG: phage tail tape measure protein [Thermoanaerobacter sp.]|nr:phage tail tape measure protein [Thermoanaerobacter sp.]